jgi:hypothetical protein
LRITKMRKRTVGVKSTQSNKNKYLKEVKQNG